MSYRSKPFHLLVATATVVVVCVWTTGCLSPGLSKECGDGKPACFKGEICHNGTCKDPAEVSAVDAASDAVSTTDADASSRDSTDPSDIQEQETTETPPEIRFHEETAEVTEVTNLDHRAALDPIKVVIVDDDEINDPRLKIDDRNVGLSKDGGEENLWHSAWPIEEQPIPTDSTKSVVLKAIVTDKDGNKESATHTIEFNAYCGDRRINSNENCDYEFDDEGCCRDGQHPEKSCHSACRSVPGTFGASRQIVAPNTSGVAATSIAVHEPTDTYYVGGVFRGTAEFDNQHSKKASSGAAFLAKYVRGEKKFRAEKVHVFGGAGEAFVYDIDVTKSGAAVAVGAFSDELTHQSLGSPLQTSNQWAAFAAQIDKKGNAEVSMLEDKAQAFGVAADDSSGDVAIVGKFEGDNGNAMVNDHYFAARYDKEGNRKWIASGPPKYITRAYDVELQSQDTKTFVVFGGEHLLDTTNSPTKFNFGDGLGARTIRVTDTSTKAGYVARLDWSNGDMEGFARVADNTSDDSVTDIATDDHGRIWVATNYVQSQGNHALCPSRSNLEAKGMALAVYGSSLNDIGKTAPTSALCFDGRLDQKITALDVRATKNVAIMGYFNGSVDLDPQGMTNQDGFYDGVGMDDTDAFLASYQLSKSSLQYDWSRAWSGAGADVMTGLPREGGLVAMSNYSYIAGLTFTGSFEADEIYNSPSPNNMERPDGLLMEIRY